MLERLLSLTLGCITIASVLIAWISKRKQTTKGVEEVKRDMEDMRVELRELKELVSEGRQENTHMKAAIERVEKRYDQFVEKIWQHFKPK